MVVDVYGADPLHDGIGGVFRASVLGNVDPLVQRRLLVRVPALLGSKGVWAAACLPAGDPGGFLSSGKGFGSLSRPAILKTGVAGGDSNPSDWQGRGLKTPGQPLTGVPADRGCIRWSTPLGVSRSRPQGRAWRARTLGLAGARSRAGPVRVAVRLPVTGVGRMPLGDPQRGGGWCRCATRRRGSYGMPPHPQGVTSGDATGSTPAGRRGCCRRPPTSRRTPRPPGGRPPGPADQPSRST